MDAGTIAVVVMGMITIVTLTLGLYGMMVSGNRK